MRSIGMQGDTVMLVSSGFVNITQFVAVIPAIIFIDRLGRCRICRVRIYLITYHTVLRATTAPNEYGSLHFPAQD